MVEHKPLLPNRDASHYEQMMRDMYLWRNGIIDFLELMDRWEAALKSRPLTTSKQIEKLYTKSS